MLSPFLVSALELFSLLLMLFPSATIKNHGGLRRSRISFAITFFSLLGCLLLLNFLGTLLLLRLCLLLGSRFGLRVLVDIIVEEITNFSIAPCHAPCQHLSPVLEYDQSVSEDQTVLLGYSIRALREISQAQSHIKDHTGLNLSLVFFLNGEDLFFKVHSDTISKHFLQTSREVGHRLSSLCVGASELLGFVKPIV